MDWVRAVFDRCEDVCLIDFEWQAGDRGQRPQDQGTQVRRTLSILPPTDRVMLLLGELNT
jgi:hypothetical protein